MKLCSKHFSTSVGFYWQKQQIRVLRHPFGDLGVTYTVHLWLVGKRVVEFLLVLIELFALALTFEAYERILIEIVVFESGWVTLSANFRGKNGSSINDSWHQKTRVPGLSRGVYVILRLAVLIQYWRVTHTHTHTHRFAIMAITRVTARG